jgi:hypothetical protein
MQPGDAALVRPDSFRGQIVSDFTNSRYCHIRLITSADGDTIEADSNGAFRGRVRKGDVIVTAPLTDAQRALIPGIADQFVGVPYDWTDVIALGLSQLGFHSPRLARRIANPDRLFCSQLVDLVWHIAKFTAFTDGRLPQAVTPGDIADLAFSSGWPSKSHDGG